jgi:GTP-binding protein EngB required for normal cell division
MDATALRDFVRQTAGDFEWLEAHCRPRADLARQAGELRLAAALTRNVIGPALDGATAPPLFVAVVGGAGAGKSTVTNLLLGETLAETNPQAGYTRHPEAFVPATTAWPGHFAFIGPLRRLEKDSPANLDEDVYQVHALKTSPAREALAETIVFDCPDMTTWAAAGYVSRLIEVAALADVIVYVASDERYNDEVPTQFLQSLLKAGKAVMVVLTKMNEANAAALVEHFRAEVLAKIASAGDGREIPIVAIPQSSLATRIDPANAPQRIALINQLLALSPSPIATRSRTVTNAVRHLDAATVGLTDVARQELAALDAWKAAVQTGRANFEARYRNEYLAGEPFRRFERSRQEALALLELPGGGQYVSTAMRVLHMPYLWMRDAVSKLVAKPEPPNLPERTVLANAMTAWFDALQAEALTRSSQNPFWKSLSGRFDSSLKSDVQSQFDAAAREFELRETGELEVAARSVVESLSSNASLLWGLRVAKAAGGIFALILVVIVTWVPSWYHVIVLLAAVAIVHQAFDWGVSVAVNSKRRAARSRREALLNEIITGPLAVKLDSAAITADSPVQRLRAILDRVPVAIAAFKSKILTGAA